AFNAPIAGMLFALEVILSSFAVRHMSSVVVASVAAAVTSRSLVGENLALNASAYRLGDYRELILYVGLALVAVAAAILFLRLLDRLEALVEKHHRASSWRRPVAFGLATAGLVVAEPLLPGENTMRLFGTGQDVTNHLLESASFAMGAPERLAELWWVLALVAIAKIVATALTLSSGASAGAFMPSLFIGAMLGSSFAKLVGPM